MQSAFKSLNKVGSTFSCESFAGSLYFGLGSDNLVLSGNYQFKVIRGLVDFCGITLTSGPQIYDASSPVAPFPVFKAVYNQIDEPLNQEECDGMAHLLEPYPSIIRVWQSDHVPDVSSIAPPYKSLWHYLRRVENQDAPLLTIPKSWQEVDHTVPSIVIVGPKNSGKSNLCKYICNRQYMSPQNNRTYYLELDPGQPEYTPPGFLSLHEIKQLNFSSGYTHPQFINVVKSHYLGYVSPMETPDRYLDMCQELLGTFRSISRSGDQLIVNTTGWTKGLGLELNQEIIAMVDPYIVLHLGPQDSFANVVVLERIEPQNLQNEPKSSNDAETGDTSLEKITSNTTITSGGFSSAELRNLQHMIYFHSHDLSHITEWDPFEVSLGTSIGIYAFAVLDSEGINLKSDLGICVEGTIVSINILDREETGLDPVALNSHDANNIWSQSHAIGLAVVQYLDLVTNTVRLLTPVDPVAHDLPNKQVILCRGRVQLPIWDFQNRKFSDSPWIIANKQPGIGSTYTRFRRNIQR